MTPIRWRGQLYDGPLDVPSDAITTACDRCPARWRADGPHANRRVRRWGTLPVALYVLSNGCAGRPDPDGTCGPGGYGEPGGAGARRRCGVRFTNVLGAEDAASIANRRGVGWTKRRVRSDGADAWSVSYDGWFVGALRRRPQGPLEGRLRWSASCHPQRDGSAERVEEGLEAIRAAVPIGADGLPETHEVMMVRRWLASKGGQGPARDP